jgi:hypothetical protein
MEEQYSIVTVCTCHGNVSKSITYYRTRIRETYRYVEIEEIRRPGILNRHPWGSITDIIITKEM